MRNEELSAAQAQFTYDIDRIAKLRKNCSKAGIIGQPRAMKALQMGMNVNTCISFNVCLRIVLPNRNCASYSAETVYPKSYLLCGPNI